MLKTLPQERSTEVWLKTYADHSCDQAFAKLVDFYGGMVYASALRRTANPELAEEVSQDVFALMARKASQLHKHSSLTGWIFTATRLRAQDVMKAERRNRARLAKLRELTAQSGVIEPIDDSRPMLDEALDRLKPRDRDVLLWRYVEERTYEEISRRLGKTSAACRKQVSRALEKLSGLLQRRGIAVSAISLGSALSAQLGRAVPPALTSSIAEVAALKAGSITVFELKLHSVQTLTSIVGMKLKIMATAAALAVLPFAVPWTIGLGLTLGTMRLMGPEVNEGPEAIVMSLVKERDDLTSRQHEAAVDAAYLRLGAQALSARSQKDKQRVMAAGLALYQAEPDGLWRTYHKMPLTESQKLHGLSRMSEEGGIVALEALKRGYLSDDPECLEAGIRLIGNAAIEYPKRCVSWLEHLAQESGNSSPYLLMSSPGLLQNMPQELQERITVLIEGALTSRVNSGQLLTVDDVTSILSARRHLSGPTNERLYKALLGSVSAMNDEAFERTLLFSSIAPPAENTVGAYTDTFTDREMDFLLANTVGAQKARFLAEGTLPLNQSQRQDALVDVALDQLPELVRSENFGVELNEHLSGPPKKNQVRDMARGILIESVDLSDSLNELNALDKPWRDAISSTIVELWASKDVVAASHALAQIETIPDAAIVALVEEIALDPDAARAWASIIQDPLLRAATLERMP